MPKSKRSAEHQAHFERLVEIGPHPDCYGTGPIQLHHCHSGSMTDNGFNRGLSKKASNWLVIPLPMDLHTGFNGIHSIGVRTWEKKYLNQFDLLWWYSDQLGYDLIKLAKDGENE